MSNASLAEVLLSEEDLQHLTDKEYLFSLGQDAGYVCVLIRDFVMAARYVPSVTDLLIRLPPNFPMARPDMFWTNPHVKLLDGSSPPQADQFDINYDGRQWQRWSRHLDATQWRPGKDNLRTFLGIIRHELQEV